MTYKNILFEINNGIATLTLNRPETRNIITDPGMIDEIESALGVVNADKSVQVLILTAADPAFSAGGNIKEMAKKQGMFSGTPEEIAANYKATIQRIPLAMQQVEAPTIASFTILNILILK